MAELCPCKYPLVVVDNREGKMIEYLAMPTSLLSDSEVPIPTIEPIETNGLDGIKRKYIAVQWQELPPKEQRHTKEYDVAGHIVVAGCEVSSNVSIKDGEMKCDSKSIYLVLHPWDDWHDFHFIQLPCFEVKTKK